MGQDGSVIAINQISFQGFVKPNEKTKDPLNRTCSDATRLQVAK